MRHPLRSPLAALCVALCLSISGCDDAQAVAGPGPDGDDTADSDTEDGDTGEDPGEVDSDEDGLSDAEEAELGTDPQVKDTDQDNYWDSWEVIEGTDPLDQDSRIYQGWWPYNPNKDELPQGSWATASTAQGTPFPRASFHDRHGDLVDLYDFTNFTINPTGQPAYIIADISAQWCGPCHVMATWLEGVTHPDTLPYETAFPTTRAKVHDLRVWWMTFIVEGGDGGPPDIGDAEVWFSTHPDPFIPVFIDESQQIRDHFNGGWYPFVFLLDPLMTVEYWNDDPPDGNSLYALDFVESEIE